MIEPDPTTQPFLAGRQNWSNRSARHALMQPDGVALRVLGETTTWRELDDRVATLAAALILMLNRTEYIESVLAVIGRSDEKWGEVPVAIVALKVTPAVCGRAGLDLRELDGFLTERAARYKHPKALEIVDALPRNPAGKVLQTDLRARFGAAESVDAGGSATLPTVSAAAEGNQGAGKILLTVTVSIRRMPHPATRRSGTFLWSVLLLTGSKTEVTFAGSGQGGRVRRGLPVRHDCRRAVGAHW